MNILIDRNKKEPVYRQIERRLSLAIEEGELADGQALPPIRELSSELGVNKDTIIRAYKNLEARHLVYTKPGSGTFAARLEKRAVTFSYPEIVPLRSKTEYEIDFTASHISGELFPLKEFRKAFNNVFDRGDAEIFGYEDPQGILKLRQTLGEYFGFNAERIQIISGAQQGLDIIAKAVLDRGDFVFTEKPTYEGAVRAFMLRGAKTAGISMEKDGPDIKSLGSLIKIYKPRLVYVMPYFQTPTTVSQSLEKKRELLRLCYENDFYIIEEDNMGDFYYGSKPLNLKALDRKNKVIYIKSFSKILMPGLRLGFMVMPRAISEAIVSAKYSADMGTSGFIQYAFESYIKSGGFERHINKVRNYYKQKYRLMKSCIEIYLKNYVDFIDPCGGLYFLLTLKKGNSDELKEKLGNSGILIDTEKRFSVGKNGGNSLRLSFADISDADIEKGIKEIGRILTEL